MFTNYRVLKMAMKFQPYLRKPAKGHMELELDIFDTVEIV
jgi:hypothetical protein